jgi:DNA polymerase I-like protein with 3'-5' exonuclease and polymerase domains
MDHCVSAYLDSDPWKILYGLSSNDEKGQPKGALSEDDLHLYNAHDAYKQAHLWMAMEKDIAANRELYEHDKQLAEICRDMQLNGVLVDEARRKELSVAIQIKVDRLYKEMVELAGHDFGPNKPKDIRAILFEQFGAPVLEKTEKTGQPSTGKKTLEAFAFQTHEKYGQFAERLGFYRLCKKVQATHIDRLPIEKDGRVHPSWRSFATPTGRWGCRKPNLMAQKIPDNRFANEPEYQIRSIYIAPKDHKYVSFDLEQVEPRMSAYLSGDENFIAAVETGDIHTAVAQIIFEKDGKLPVELKDSKTAKTLGKPMRQVAKKCGLGISYGAGAEKIFETLRADKHKITFTQVVACLSKLQKKFRRYYDFVQENVEGCQWDGYIIVGFLTKRKRHLGHAPKPQEVANCVDAKTEALTQRGWVPGFKLRRDDVLLTKNAGTGRLEWQAMTDLKLYPNYMGRLYEFKSKAFSAVTTPEHRWLVYHNQRDRDEERISSELSLYGDDRIHRTGFYTSPKKKYSDNLIELIGWFLTDGWFNWGSSGLCPTAFLCQSQRANAHKVKMIDNLVERMCMPHSRYYYVSLKLHELFPERVLTPEFLLTITRRQAKLLIKTMMLGDGMVDAFGRRRFCTGKKESAELFQALCVMAGMASTLHKRDQTSSDYQPRCGIHWLVTLLRRDKAQLVKHQRRVFSGKRKVWCPVVPNSFFVARREGKVFITGNSPIQGGAADLMNTRMIELYRWFERVYNKLKKVVRIVAQVHDQVIVEVPDHLVTRVQADIRRIMGRKVRIRDKEVFFPIEEKTGLRWSEV